MLLSLVLGLLQCRAEPSDFVLRREGCGATLPRFMLGMPERRIARGDLRLRCLQCRIQLIGPARVLGQRRLALSERRLQICQTPLGAGGSCIGGLYDGIAFADSCPQCRRLLLDLARLRRWS